MSKTLPFEKALCLTKTDRKIESDTITRQIQAVETKAKVLDFKTTQVQVPESSIIRLIIIFYNSRGSFNHQ